MIASEGAQLTMLGSLLERSKIGGLLLDGHVGPGGTRAFLDEVQILDSEGRGVWAQGLLGSRENPALQIVGSRLEGNRLVGFGASESVGIIIVDGTVGSTRVKSSPVRGDERSELIGDGLMLIDSSDVFVQGTRFENNDRAQILIDSCGEGVEFVDISVAFEDGAYGVVVQDSIPPSVDGRLVEDDAPAMGTPPDVALGR